MKPKLAISALLALLGFEAFSQAFIKQLPVISDSTTFSVESFRSNGILLPKCLNLQLNVDTAYIGKVLLEPICLPEGHMKSFYGYMKDGMFSACGPMHNTSCVDGELVLDGAKIRMVRIRQSPTSFR